MDLLRDPVWQFWGAMFALLAILVTVVVAAVTIWYQRRSKNLSCEVLSRAQLVGISDKAGSMSSRLRILYDNKEIENAQLLVLRIRNSGNIPITPSDYVEPVTIVFSQGTRVLNAEVAETDPANLEVTTIIGEDRVGIDPTLLNKNDSITLKFLLAGSDASFKPNGRIIGVKDMRVKSATSSSPERRRALIAVYLSNLMIFLVLYAVSVLIGEPTDRGDGFRVLLGVVVIFTGFFLIIRVAGDVDRETRRP